MRYFQYSAILGSFVLLLSSPSQAQDFQYTPAGQLVSGSGTGRVDDTLYASGMRYPMEAAPSYPNSQVHGRGGSQGGGGSQCDAENYSYPWWDNYCESRQWDVPLCPSGNGHQGQDIRPATCENNVHWNVASEAGRITNIGSYSMILTMDDGSVFRYLHMQRASYPVGVGDTVQKGARLGKTSNEFGGTPTTIHLHYDIMKNISPHGVTFVPPYMSLVRSYEELLGMPAQPCGVIPAEGGIVDDASTCMQLFGPLQYWRNEQAGFMGTLRWTKTIDAADPSNWARFQLHFATAGRYRVEAYIEPGYNDTQQLRYTLRAGGVEQEIVFDQSSASGWSELFADVEFAAEGDQWLALYDNTGEANSLDRKIVADAVRLTRLDPPQPMPDMGTPAEEDMGSSADMGGVDDEDASVAEADLGGGADMAGWSEINSASTESTCASVPRRNERVWPALLCLVFAVGCRRLRSHCGH
jgi:murein DD-endopeptidase MepM/ murein hydrolase activator NlpD